MAQGPQPLRPKRMRKADIGFIIILFIMLIGMFIFITRNTNKPVTLKQDEFLKLITQQQVQEVTATPVGGDNISLWHFTGVFISDNEKLVLNYMDMMNYTKKFIV